ncbi:MAG: hypothetical protein AABY22_28820, partial [Nanoarchaeota archaeon]
MSTQTPTANPSIYDNNNNTVIAYFVLGTFVFVFCVQLLGCLNSSRRRMLMQKQQKQLKERIKEVATKANEPNNDTEINKPSTANAAATTAASYNILKDLNTDLYRWAFSNSFFSNADSAMFHTVSGRSLAVGALSLTNLIKGMLIGL